MATKRKQYTAAFKAQVAVAARKGDKTINELASQLGVHPTLIQDWKKHLLTTAEQLFASGVKAKYEEVYRHRYEAVPQLVSGLERSDERLI